MKKARAWSLHSHGCHNKDYYQILDSCFLHGHMISLNTLQHPRENGLCCVPKHGGIVRGPGSASVPGRSKALQSVYLANDITTHLVDSPSPVQHAVVIE
ncbi:hypothetical protein IAQ61_007354 [Plenodomus lingam]|uniref:uncharacterized protein n=1 Tax=Leptosphaeria maculans TaxID=5022 RepID=UPI00332F6C03|nr:hypothetical protein IAQ61_007354 [Plenodomus lingam]